MMKIGDQHKRALQPKRNFERIFNDWSFEIYISRARMIAAHVRGNLDM